MIHIKKIILIISTMLFISCSSIKIKNKQPNELDELKERLTKTEVVADYYRHMYIQQRIVIKMFEQEFIAKDRLIKKLIDTLKNYKKSI